MIEHFLPQVDFSSYEDFLAHFKVNVPDNFNFAYDVVDVYAEQQPEKEAILWSNDKGDVRHPTYREVK